MLNRRIAQGFVHPFSSEITPETAYLNRRAWLAQMGVGVAAFGALGTASAIEGGRRPLRGVPSKGSGAGLREPGTAEKDATSYSNYYEFGFDKDEPARLAHKLTISPWTVRINGEVHKPQTVDMDTLLKLAPLEERVYRLRCVEGWSMVIPWVGYSLSALLARAQPKGNAKYVQFVTVQDTAAMPGLRNNVLDWPYLEALRMDEAMHPLTLLSMGMYGKTLPKQNGAPVRLVVPWKYGFKSGKSVVAIRLTEQMPKTSWSVAAPREYGFFANVNPKVPHPRWQQDTERRIGEPGGLFAKRRPTLMFNGYEAQVGQMYAGMDLARWY